MTDKTRDDVPDDANKGCPGSASDQAGKSSSCAGCPNQQACASGAGREIDPAIAAIGQKLKKVKHIILVLSGKGGVGKSTFSSQLAFSLAAQDLQVGLLDIDICGPSIPQMLGLSGRQVHQSGSGWSPVWLNENLGVMSIGFMLPSNDDAVIWRGPRKNGLIRQFLSDVEWGDLDYLVIDTPPGTSDEHITIAQYLQNTALAGALVVTTPQEVAMSDVRKELNFCVRAKVPIVGVVENMSGFQCPSCGNHSYIFPPAGGGAASMAEKFQVPFLGRVPLDHRLVTACEAGESFLSLHPDAAAASPLRSVVTGVRKFVEDHPDTAAEWDDVQQYDRTKLEHLAKRKEALEAELRVINSELATLST